MPPKKEDPLAKQVGRLADIIEARARLRRRFLSGLIFGFGSAIGATIIAGIVIYVGSAILEATGIIESLQPFTQLELPAGTHLEGLE